MRSHLVIEDLADELDPNCAPLTGLDVAMLVVSLDEALALLDELAGALTTDEKAKLNGARYAPRAVQEKLK